MKKLNNVSKQKTKKTNVEEAWWSDATRGVSRAAGSVAGGIGQIGAEMGKGYRSGARAVAGHDYDSLAKLAQKVIDKKVRAYDLDPADRNQLMDFINNGGVPAGTKTASGHNVSAGDINNALSSLSQAQGGGEAAPDANTINSALGGFNQWQGDSGEAAPDPSSINAALGGVNQGQQSAAPQAPAPGGQSNGGGVRAPQTGNTNSMVSDMISRLKQLAGVFTRAGDKKSAETATSAANTVARIEPTAADDAGMDADNTAAPQAAAPEAQLDPAADNAAPAADNAAPAADNAAPASQFQQMMQQGKGASQSADPAAAQAFINKMKRKPGDVSGTATSAAAQNSGTQGSEWEPEVGINSADDDQDQSWIEGFNDVEITPRELNTTIASIDKNAAPEIAKAVVAAVTPDGTTDLKTVLANVTPEQQNIIKQAINYTFNPPQGKTAFSTTPQNTGIGGTTPNGGNYNHNQTPYGKTTTNAPSKVPMNIVTPVQVNNLKQFINKNWLNNLGKEDKSAATTAVDKLLKPLIAKPDQLTQLGWTGQETKNGRVNKDSTADTRSNKPIVLPPTPPAGLSMDQYNNVAQVINQYNEYIKRVNPLANTAQQPAQTAAQAAPANQLQQPTNGKRLGKPAKPVTPVPQSIRASSANSRPVAGMRSLAQTPATPSAPTTQSIRAANANSNPVSDMRRMMNAVNGKRK